MEKGMQALTRVGAKIKVHLVKLEVITLLVFLIHLILITQNSNILSVFATMLMLTLSFAYFILAFSETKTAEVDVKRFLNFEIQWSLSICIIGLLFVSRSLPGGYIQLMLGTLGLAAGILTGTILRKKFQLAKIMDKNLYMRVVVILMLSVFFQTASNDSLRSFNIAPKSDISTTEYVQDSE